MSLSANLIGSGRIGLCVARLLRQHQLCQFSGIVNRTMTRSVAAVAALGEGQAYAGIPDLPPADITLIATPDHAIQACAQLLAKSAALKNGSLIVHFSGAMSSAVLQPLRERGCVIASLHPLRSFATGHETLAGAYCSLEGDEQAMVLLTNWCTALQAHPFHILSEKKPTYHAAAVMASNYLVTLFANANKTFISAGIPEDLAGKITQTLMQSSLNHLATHTPEESLTGPIQRGDCETILHHLQALSTLDEKIVYAQLGLATLPVANLPSEKHAALTAIFNHVLQIDRL